MRRRPILERSYIMQDPRSGLYWGGDIKVIETPEGDVWLNVATEEDSQDAVVLSPLAVLEFFDDPCYDHWAVWEVNVG